MSRFWITLQVLLLVSHDGGIQSCYVVRQSHVYHLLRAQIFQLFVLGDVYKLDSASDGYLHVLYATCILVYTVLTILTPNFNRPPLRSVVVRASARGAGGPGSIPDRVTPKT